MKKNQFINQTFIDYKENTPTWYRHLGQMSLKSSDSNTYQFLMLSFNRFAYEKLEYDLPIPLNGCTQAKLGLMVKGDVKGIISYVIQAYDVHHHLIKSYSHQVTHLVESESKNIQVTFNLNKNITFIRCSYHFSGDVMNISLMSPSLYLL